MITCEDIDNQDEDEAVESVGIEDALEEVPVRRRKASSI